MTSMGRIRRSAVRLFAVRGFTATGIREIGREVGLNSATLYHHSGGKEELLVGIMQACLDELLRAGSAALVQVADPAVQLARLVRTHVAIEAINPCTARVTDREVHALSVGNCEHVVGMRDDYQSMFQQVLERGVLTGQFQLTDVRVVTLALLEMCNGVANWFRPDARLTIPELQDRFVELSCRLSGARLVTRDECGPDVKVVRLESEPFDRSVHNMAGTA